MKGALLILLLAAYSLVSFAPINKEKFNQLPVSYPKGYFRNPLDIPIQLIANFGELRPNHYHMGLDIRTNQRENLPVYAAAEGYVSKIKIEKGGFGRAIYITHPNGFTTLYAHLNNFFPALHEFVVSKQYKDEKWEQDFKLLPGQFPVTKGQFIAYSGNTGGSSGPHLHFEIRDSKTENNLNPWLFDMGLPDNVPPSVYRLYYYDRRFSTYESTPLPIAISGGSGHYSTVNKVVVLSSPKISFGITAEDKTSTASHNFGIYEASLTIDDTLRSLFRMNDISYNETRYLNAAIDYKTRLNDGPFIQHLSRLPGNRCSIFPGLGNGVFTINDTAVHRVYIEVKDAAGNRSVMQFYCRYSQSQPKFSRPDIHAVSFAPNVENLFASEEIVAAFSPIAFYDTVYFMHKSEPANESNAVSASHDLHHYSVPVHDSFSIRIKSNVCLKSELENRVVMKMAGKKKTEIVKGIWKGSWMEARFKSFGKFTLLLDTIAPKVSASGWVNGANLSSRKGFAILAQDNLGNVKMVNGYVDGKWILFSKKDNLFIHTFDDRIAPGKHELVIKAEDEAGNVAEKVFTFTK